MSRKKKRYVDRPWVSFFISFILPLIGGLLVYLKTERKDEELALICLLLSIFHPVFIGFLVGFMLIGDLLIFPAWIITIFVLTLTFMQILKKNKYRYFIPVWYLGLIGAVYSYFWGYRNDRILKRSVGLFFVMQSLAFIGISFFLAMLYVHNVFQIASFETIINETVNIPTGYYYFISFFSPPGVNLLEVKIEASGETRFNLLEPSECVRFKKGEDYYTHEQVDVISLSSTYTLTSEGEWCIILFNLLQSNISVHIEAHLWYEYEV